MAHSTAVIVTIVGNCELGGFLNAMRQIADELKVQTFAADETATVREARRLPAS